MLLCLKITLFPYVSVKLCKDTIFFLYTQEEMKFFFKKKMVTKSHHLRAPSRT